DPDPRLEALDCERAILHQAMVHVEARAPYLLNSRLDHHLVAIAGRYEKARPRLDHRIAVEFVGLVKLVLVEAERSLEQQHGRMVEHRHIARIKHDAGGVAVAPFDADSPAVHEHAEPNPLASWPGYTLVPAIDVLIACR